VKPTLLFSKGGFVSVPPCAAAASLGIPVFTHESDYSPGLATKLNSRWAERILTAYPSTVEGLPTAARMRAALSGNPVRSAFFAADAARGRAFLGIGPDERVLLVLGGSQGARQVNDLIAAALPDLTARYVVVHQTGKDADQLPESSARYRRFEYIREELPDILAAAELVVGRAGAGTVWEAAAAGKPMLLVPLAGSGTRGDQVENAAYFQRIGAARSLTGTDASPDSFRVQALRIADDSALRSSMAAAAVQVGTGDAAEAIARMIVERMEGLDEHRRHRHRIRLARCDPGHPLFPERFYRRIHVDGGSGARTDFRVIVFQTRRAFLD
jgi:UDP-N-acetylglucosamine--N-acetylmuramyl-(pentapeptide) pyrophosphoryl-undecaprenol N-acetylglucosamine transferase